MIGANARKYFSLLPIDAFILLSDGVVQPIMPMANNNNIDFIKDNLLPIYLPTNKSNDIVEYVNI